MNRCLRLRSARLLVLAVLTWCSLPAATLCAAGLKFQGPLRVHPANPRYFTDGTTNSAGALRAIYLTGSHTWHVLQDQGTSYPPRPFDYEGFITFLRTNHHNFFRIWTWEHSRWACWSASDKFWYRPSPYRRVEGHGVAQDGLPKFDLTQFEPEYFLRLSNRVAQAHRNGIYVAVMLFQGVSVEFKKPHYKLPWNSHPFHRSNNVNHIDADTNGDGQGYDVHEWPLAPGVWDLQRAYIRKVIDTVNGFDNVLYEVANECHTNSQTWQYEVIKFIKGYEATSKPKQHPVGMTAEYPNGGTSDLMNSPADWISPSVADWDKDEPPAATGRKIILADTDHLPGQPGDADFVWKAFIRGNHPIVMDDLAVTNAARFSARRAMGVTRRLAERMNLAAMTPHGELASSGFCLANPAREFLVYQPAGGDVEVDLSGVAGEMLVEWIHPVEGFITPARAVMGGAKRTLKPPFTGPAAALATVRLLPAITHDAFAAAGKTPFTWSNPLPFEYTEGQTAPRREVRDPCIIREGDTYYLVFTMWPFANREEKRMALPDNGSSPGIALYSSPDLKRWTFEHWLVKSSELPENCPYKHRFWAPEIHKMGGKFYLIFTADNWLRKDYNPAGSWGTAGYAFVGVSDKVTGPYEHITYLKGAACDTTLFEDTDGRTYAVIPRYHIDLQEIDLTGLSRSEARLVGQPKKIVSAENTDIGVAAKPDYLEGPWLAKISGKYHLFYAAIYRDKKQPDWLGYHTGVAVADAVTGPYRKDPRGRIFTGGHLAVFKGPDGRSWFSYRGESNNPARGRLCIDPLNVDADGTIRTVAPTVGEPPASR